MYELQQANDLDVFELAPTLVALAAVIREANRVINPEGPDVAVRIKPFKPGSFEIHTILGSVPPDGLFVGGALTATAIYKVLKELGLIAKSAESLLGVIERLRGKAKSVEKTRTGYTIHGESGATVATNNNIGQLIQNQNITQNIYHVYAPIERGSSESIKTYVPQIPNSEVTVTKEELPALREAAAPGEITSSDEKINERTIQAVVHPKRGSFDRDGSSWSFKWGEQVITATVKDKQFLAQYDAGDIRLNGHDSLNVTMIERQKHIGEIVKSPTYEIVKVTGHQRGLQQPKLLIEE